MKPYPFGLSLCALGLLAASSGPAEAAWNNVFQVTCHRRSCAAKSAFVQVPVVAQAAPADPCCNPCPQPVCTTRYVQRCYYQPVTSYTTKTYYEPVTTYTTKYYYEPVVSYRYTCQYDPCTGCSQQVACPVTSYCLKAQCCPVQSWVQRCCQVPCTTYQRVSYWEPQTCCVNPCNPCNPCSNGGAVGAVPAPPVVGQAPPQVQEQHPPVQTNPPPIIKEQGGSGNGGAPGGPTDRYYGPNAPAAPGAFRHPLPKAPVPAQPAAPAIRMERIAFAPDAHLNGQVVKLDRSPRAGARVMFVNAGRQAANQTVTANTAGRFQVNLASGAWLVYVTGQDGRPVFNGRIDVSGRPAALTVTAQ